MGNEEPSSGEGTGSEVSSMTMRNGKSRVVWLQTKSARSFSSDENGNGEVSSAETVDNDQHQDKEVDMESPQSEADNDSQVSSGAMDEDKVEDEDKNEDNDNDRNESKNVDAEEEFPVTPPIWLSGKEAQWWRSRQERKPFTPHFSARRQEASRDGRRLTHFPQDTATLVE